VEVEVAVKAEAAVNLEWYIIAAGRRKE